jgi:SanA protein
MAPDKNAIRNEMRARRKAVSPDARAAASHSVCEQLLSLLGDARLVCCYEALPTELDLSEFISSCGREVVFPEKKGDAYAVPRAAEVDLWVCPGLAFSKSGARIGFGGGWYDRFLAAAKPSARAYGVAYGFQVVPELPQGEFDRPLDGVVVAKGRQTIKRKLLKGFSILAAGTLVVWLVSVAVIAVVASGRVFDAETLASVPKTRAAVVLGCPEVLQGGFENLYFRQRIDAATELYRAGKATAFIVSGDNHVKWYDEPTRMKAALVKAGVPADRIVCDYAGFRTLDSVVRAKQVFGADSFIVVSQPDHVRRAVFLARGFGCEAWGYASAGVSGRGAIKVKVREQFAKIAAVVDVIVRRSPKFLGPKEALPEA